MRCASRASTLVPNRHRRRRRWRPVKSRVQTRHDRLPLPLRGDSHQASSIISPYLSTTSLLPIWFHRRLLLAFSCPLPATQHCSAAARMNVWTWTNPWHYRLGACRTGSDNSTHQTGYTCPSPSRLPHPAAAAVCCTRSVDGREMALTHWTRCGSIPAKHSRAPKLVSKLSKSGARPLHLSYSGLRWNA